MTRTPVPTRLIRMAGAAMSMFAPALALADVPAAMDRCPNDAPLVISIKDAGKLHSSVNAMMTSLKVPAQAMQGVGKIGDMLKMPGLNTSGSLAVAVLSLDEGGDPENPALVVVLPVKDYASFATGLGGKGTGLEEVKFEDHAAFIKDLGSGYAAMSPQKDLAEKFEGKAGHGKAFESAMGATGKSVAESSDAFILANMTALGPKMQEGMEGFKQQMEMMAAMAGGGANAAGFEMIGSLMDGFVRDASAGVMGFKADEAGLHLDFGAQFKEGSSYGSYFEAKGKASALTGTIPNQAFLFAMAIDTSSPGFKKIAKNALEISKKDPEAAKMMSGLNPLESIEKIDGMSMCMGQTPALMGGLFLNTSLYVKTTDPAGYVKTMKDGFGSMNGKTLQGVTYQTGYESGGGKVGEMAVDAWSMKMSADPNSPEGAQIAQAQMMMFGPGGLGGYVAKSDGGVVVTYSKNSELMTKCLEASKSGNGLTGDAGVKAVAAQLPADRMMEMYVGVKSIMETALGFMSMMGAGPANFEIPADLPPVGIGMTGVGGGVRMAMFIPTKVIQTVQTLTQSMEGGGEPEEPAPKDKAGQPKF